MHSKNLTYVKYVQKIVHYNEKVEIHGYIRLETSENIGVNLNFLITDKITAEDRKIYMKKRDVYGTQVSWAEWRKVENASKV